MRHYLIALIALLLPTGALTAAAAPNPARQYCDATLKQCDRAQKQIPEFTRVAETVAQRHLRGGALGCVVVGSVTLTEELTGRAGGMVNFGFDRVWTKERTAAEKSNDIALVSWHQAAGSNDLARIQALQHESKYVIGFGPRGAPGMAAVATGCDAFFDTGTGADDRAVTLPDGTRVGKTVHLANALNGWVFIAELVGALTRQGKMPAMYMSYACAEGKEWGAKYMWKKQFHDDYTIAPIPAGDLGRAYVAAIRQYTTTFRQTQLPTVAKAVDLLAAAAKDGQKVLVLPTGHMPSTFVGNFEDARWVKQVDFQYMGHKDAVLAAKAEGQLALRLGYFGEPPELTEVLRSQKFRLIYVSSGNPRPGYQIAEERLLNIDTGMPFGDACVSIKNYPIKVFAPSGIMQIVAYEAINTEVLSRLTKTK